jgi:hypothetical protein
MRLYENELPIADCSGYIDALVVFVVLTSHRREDGAAPSFGRHYSRKKYFAFPPAPKQRSILFFGSI